MSVRVRVFGPVTVEGAAPLAPRDRRVLAALVVEPGRVCPADRLADALYGADPPPTWRKVVQGSIGRLRQVLGAHAITTVGDGYRLELGDDELDTRRFERLVSEAADLSAAGEHERAAMTLDAALALSSSDPLADLDGWEPGRAAAARFDELRRLAEEGAVRSLLASGQNERALAAAAELVVREPLREYRWVALALAQYRTGRQGEALRSIARARRTLADELGLDPGPDLVALERAILAQDSDLLGPADTAPGGITRCPYLGLAAYDVDDADWFFGRDWEVAECLTIVARTGFLAVVGSSGSGKSSLARAGVAPALRRDDRPVAVVTPGRNPDAALTGVAPGSVLVVDQLEELVALCHDPAARARFVSAIGTWSVTAPVIVTLRADHLAAAAELPELAARVQDGLFLLGAMGESQLRAAIEVPATKVGLRLEPGLVDLLVRDVSGEPGALPLLSHALAETFEHREGPVLTLAGYRAVGGVQGAVARAADIVIDSLPPAGRRAAKDLFLRLVIATDLTEPVRQRIPRAALTADPATAAVLDALVRTRLVISDADTVEVAHEAVCRAWPRLRDWLDEDREGIRIHQHLTRSAQDWEQSGGEAGELYRGARLAAAVEWAAGDVELNPTERAFLDAGAAQRDAQERAAHDQLRRQQQANRRLRAALTGVGVLLVIALIAGLIAWRQRDRADTQADLARSEADRADTQAGIARSEAERADEESAIARSRELAAAAVSVLADDPTLSKLLAVTAASLGEPTTESIAALHQAWAADRVVNRLPPPPQPLNGTYASINPSGTRAVIGGGGDLTAGWNYLEVVDPRTGDVQWTFEPPYFSANPARPFFSPDGSTVVTGVVWVQKPWEAPDPDPESLGAFFLDAGTGEIVDHVDLGRCGGIVAGMSATHLLVKTLRGRPEQTCDWVAGPIAVELVDRSNDEPKLLTGDGTAWMDGAALSADGRYVAFDDLGTGHANVVDVASGETLLSFESHDWHVRALSTDGSLLAYGDPIEIWDVASGKVVATYLGHEGASYYATFDATGATVYSTGEDGNLHHWEARTGRPISVLSKIGQLNVSASANGIILVNASNSTTNVIDTRVRGEVGAIETCPGSVLRDSLEVAGGIVAVGIHCDGDTDATTYVADVETGKVLYTLSGQGPRVLSISPDGTRFVRQEANGTMVGPLTIRDLATGDTIVKLDGLCMYNDRSTQSMDEQEGCRPYPQPPFALWTERLRWSPDGKMLAAGSPGGAIVWDTASGAMLHAEVAPPTSMWFRAAEDNYAFDTIFTPDSSRLIISGNGEVRSLRTDTWKLERQAINNSIGGYTLGFLGFSPDASTLLGEGRAGGDPGGTLQWLDPESLRSKREVWPTHDAGVASRAVSPDSSLVATGAADGLVRVWDARTGVLVHEIPLGGPRVAGVDFIDDAHLAATLDGGNIQLVTIDPAELLDIVRHSLARGFTESECNRFGFDDNCPTLVELRGQRPGSDDPSVLNGTYQLEWTNDELVAATIDAYPEQNVTRELAETIWAGAYGMQKAGRHTLRLADGRFDHTVISDDGVLTECIGSYRVNDTRVELISERGGCEPRRVFDAAFEISHGELRFTDYIGDPTEYVLFTSKPWQRTS